MRTGVGRGGEHPSGVGRGGAGQGGIPRPLASSHLIRRHIHFIKRELVRMHRFKFLLRYILRHRRACHGGRAAGRAEGNRAGL